MSETHEPTEKLILEPERERLMRKCTDCGKCLMCGPTGYEVQEYSRACKALGIQPNERLIAQAKAEQRRSYGMDNYAADIVDARKRSASPPPAVEPQEKTVRTLRALSQEPVVELELLDD